MDSQMDETAVQIQTVLQRQKVAQRSEGPPSEAMRRDRIERAIDILLRNRTRFQRALNSDFGHRSALTSDFTDMAPAIKELRHAHKQLPRWTRPDRRRLEVPLGLLGARGRVAYQPKGVVGVMSPWNFPLFLTFGPLAGILAAGNRAMVKPSELAPETSALIAHLVRESFDSSEVHVVTGNAEVAATFSALPFDHLLFTGSTAVGRQVMRAAAENLVPLTLELGGKSPAILTPSAHIPKAATAIMHGKILNAGQACIAPDYLLLTKDHEAEFVTAARAAVAEMFPHGVLESEDYTSVLGQSKFDRLQALIEDARRKGAEIVELAPTEGFTPQPHHKLPPTLILGARDDMRVLQEEIFGPILPLRRTETLEDAIEYINVHARPLALYLFAEDPVQQEQILTRTHSGGVSINDTMMHIAQENLPFGGCGTSGFGRYHGHDGFLEFSHHKAIYQQMRFDLLKFLRPPYRGRFRQYLEYVLKR